MACFSSSTTGGNESKPRFSSPSTAYRREAKEAAPQTAAAECHPVNYVCQIFFPYFTHIFERFFRVGDPGQQTISGPRLGLYLSAEIVKGQGGEMRVEKRQNRRLAHVLAFCFFRVFYTFFPGRFALLDIGS
jgi:hypothetical protein